MATESPIPDELIQRMRALGVEDRDLVERFIKGSGPGGQKVNKTSSCVQLRHTPSGVEVKCQHGRSLTANRAEARRLICDTLEERDRVRRERNRAAAEKKRRQMRRPSKNKRKINVANKRKHAEKKRMRGKPGAGD
jgi:protein subunit release factor B